MFLQIVQASISSLPTTFNMNNGYIAGAAVGILILIYLIYVLLKPEKH